MEKKSTYKIGKTKIGNPSFDWQFFRRLAFGANIMFGLILSVFLPVTGTLFFVLGVSGAFLMKWESFQDNKGKYVDLTWKREK